MTLNEKARVDTRDGDGSCRVQRRAGVNVKAPLVVRGNASRIDRAHRPNEPRTVSRDLAGGEYEGVVDGIKQDRPVIDENEILGVSK